MNFNKQNLLTISRALRMSKSSVPLVGVWKLLSDFEDIEIFHNRNGKKQLALTFKNRENIRKFVHRESGFDPLDPLEDMFKTSRTDLAKKTKNEKLAEDPFASTLLVASSAPNGIPLKSGNLQSPVGIFIGLDWKQLNLSSIEQIVIIENGDTFKQWFDLSLPNTKNNVLFIYRGHGTNQNKLVELLEHLPEHVELTGFFDPDPQGILLLHQFNVHTALLPAFFVDDSFIPIDFVQDFCKEDAFTKQINQINKGVEKLPTPLKNIFINIKKKRWAFTQEHLIAHNISLVKIFCID